MLFRSSNSIVGGTNRTWCDSSSEVVDDAAVEIAGDGSAETEMGSTSSSESDASERVRCSGEGRRKGVKIGDDDGPAHHSDQRAGRERERSQHAPAR